MSKKEEKEVRASDRTGEDTFEVIRQSWINCIDESGKMIPQYMQSMTNLQNACMDSCKKMAESSISIAKEVTEAAWGSGRFPSSIASNASEVAQNLMKIVEANIKSAIAGIDAATQNVKLFKDNTDTFAKMNANMIKAWQSLTGPMRT